MSIEVVLEGALEKEKDREQFSQYLKDVCVKKKVHIEDYDATLMKELLLVLQHRQMQRDLDFMHLYVHSLMKSS